MNACKAPGTAKFFQSDYTPHSQKEMTFLSKIPMAEASSVVMPEVSGGDG